MHAEANTTTSSSLMNPALENFLSDREDNEITLFAHVDLVPLPEDLIKIIVGATFSCTTKELTSTNKAGHEETEVVEKPAMIIDFFVGKNQARRHESGWEIALDGSVDFNKMRFPYNIKNREAWMNASPVAGPASLKFIRLFFAVFSGPSLKNIGEFVLCRQMSKGKKQQELETLRGMLQSFLATPHEWADFGTLLTAAQFLVKYSLLDPTAFQAIFPGEPLPENKKEKKQVRKERKKAEKSEETEKLEGKMGLQISIAEKKVSLSAMLPPGDAVEYAADIIMLRGAINKIARLQTQMGQVPVTKHGVLVDKVRTMTVEEGQRELDQVEVDILSDLIIENHNTSVSTSVYFAIDDELTTSAIKLSGVNYNFGTEEPVAGSEHSVDYGSAGGNTYKAALNSSFLRKPSLKSVEFLRYRDGEVYAFGHLVELLRGMFSVCFFVCFLSSNRLFSFCVLVLCIFVLYAFFCVLVLCIFVLYDLFV